ncbi:MAG: hypothetical protein RIQ33_895, partial [Bacteroidota bacterium]
MLLLYKWIFVFHHRETEAQSLFPFTLYHWSYIIFAKKISMVTYLLGAGASANALPLVGDDFKNRFEVFVNDIKRVRPANQSRLRHYNSFLDDALKHIKNHASPDTYAKKRFLLGEQHKTIYEQFKRILSCYIIWEQINKPEIERLLKSTQVQTLPNLIEHINHLEKVIKVNDDRYDVLCAALQNAPAKLPHNFSLITWNYDWQFEKTLNQYDHQKWPLNQTKDDLIYLNKLL